MNKSQGICVQSKCFVHGLLSKARQMCIHLVDFGSVSCKKESRIRSNGRN